MVDTSEPSRVRPEAVGQERSAPDQNKRGVGGFFKMNLVTWIVVVALALVFVVAIIVAAN